ncbi:hypothetical protein LINGRAPRIM_LOCUS2587 [Linum grandiflorum]
MRTSCMCKLENKT